MQHQMNKTCQKCFEGLGIMSVDACIFRKLKTVYKQKAVL